MKSSHCLKYEQKNQIVTYLYIMSCTYMFQNLMKKQVNIKKSQLRMQISKPFLFFRNHVYFCAYYVFRANANQIIDAISEITSTLLYTWDRNILVGYFYFVRHHFWKITFDILKIVCGCLIHKTYALSFYRSQNVLCWSKFFVPEQKFIYILWQPQIFCARQKDDLHSVKLVFVPAQNFLKRH